MKKLHWMVLLSSSVAFATETSGHNPTGAQVMTQISHNLKLDGYESLATLTIYNRNNEKIVRKMAILSKYSQDKTEKRLVRFLAPNDVKGTGLLTFDRDSDTDDMWLYLPALRKTRRIVASEKSKSFMGSEFSYADITPPPVGDYSHKIVRSEVVGDIPCWVVESTATKDEVSEQNGFYRRIIHVRKVDNLPKKSLYFNKKGKLIKELFVHRTQLIDPRKKRYQLMHMEMINKQNGRRSEFIIERIKLRPNVGEQYFSSRYLER